MSGALCKSSQFEIPDTLSNEKALEVADFITNEKNVILLFPCCNSYTKKSVGVKKASVFWDDSKGTYGFHISGKDFYGLDINEKVDVIHIFYNNGFKAKCIVDLFDLSIGHPRAFRWKRYW